MEDTTKQASTCVALVAAEPQVFARDINASRDFFIQKLGFTLEFVYGEPPYYAQVKRGGARINLRYVDKPVIDPDRQFREFLLSASITVETTAEIRTLFREFDSNGVAFRQALKLQPWGALDFIVKDPDGNLLLFAGPAK